MSLKEGFVDRHILDSYDPPFGVQLLNAIDQEKGIPMRQEGLNFGLFHYGHRRNLLYQDAEKVRQQRSRFPQRLNVPKRTPLLFARCGLAGRPF
jgi:hypothetical protein